MHVDCSDHRELGHPISCDHKHCAEAVSTFWSDLNDDGEGEYG